ncbi:MAG TPA: HupE/UreJ family protein [Bryobacteraceae bacterium]|nr:HupE/UreJ family protein [Bryobacteraceae bacterium]
MRAFSIAALLAAVPGWAHVVSMSTGELRVDGPTAVYELRMPMYEAAHVANPETLIDHIRFAGAQRTSAKCHEEDGTYVCVANYEFPGLIERLEVECTYYQVTVPNHVHLLNATLLNPHQGPNPGPNPGPNTDEVVFDQSFPRSEIRFRPPSRFEVVSREMGTGIWRAIVSPAVLFLLILVVATRTPREGLLLMTMYLAGEWIMRPIAPKIPWTLSPRFVEAAMALTVAYLALEILTLPQAGSRWAVVLVLGLFHGLYFAAFPATYLAGAITMQVLLVVLLAWIALKWTSPMTRRMSAGILLAAGLGWFVTRLIHV